MPCSRCGQNNRAPRPAPAPSVLGRPGAGSINPPQTVSGQPSSGVPSNAIRSAIQGLKYVPTK